MADRVPHGKRFSRISLKAFAKQVATNPPSDKTPKPSAWPVWLRGRYAVLAGAAAALLIVAIPFTSGCAVYSWLSHRSAVAQQPEASVVPSIPVVQTTPTAPVQTAELTTPPPVDAAPSNDGATPTQSVFQPPLPQPERKEPEPLPPLKRIDSFSEEELRKQLLLVPEVAVDIVPATTARLRTLAASYRRRGDTFPGPIVLLASRPDWQGLPFHQGLDGELGSESAATLNSLSMALHGLLLEKPFNLTNFRNALTREDDKNPWRKAEAVPCLIQVLQVEDVSVRLVLVETLGKISDKKATRALAKRALSDLNAEVREAAAQELSKRPREDYRPLLLGGLRYPWSPVALHAAETLAYVKDTEAVPELVKLLDQPDTTLPFAVRQGGKETFVIREVVRINHLSSCVLCHAPSFKQTDLVRGQAPVFGQPLSQTWPVWRTGYGGFGGEIPDDPGSMFVRASTTFLRQDFSVKQPVHPHGAWPEYQRFDYLVRTRTATTLEMQLLTHKNPAPTKTTSQQAIRFALRKITGKEYEGPAAK